MLCKECLHYNVCLYHQLTVDFDVDDGVCLFFTSRENWAEVRHGEWIPSESDFDDDDTLFDVEEWCDWQCSACHEDICYEDPMERRWLPKFCPNCGCKMDKED